MWRRELATRGWLGPRQSSLMRSDTSYSCSTCARHSQLPTCVVCVVCVVCRVRVVHYLNRFLVSTGEPEHLGQIVAGTGDLQMTATQARRNVSYAVEKSVG
jgi:hypothetical protein